MWLTASDFADKGKIPRVCTCEGDHQSPAFTWAKRPLRPAALRSSATIRTRRAACFVPVPPTTVTGLARGEGRATQEKFKQAVNFWRPGYGGPRPPRGHGAHRCWFRLLALSIDRLPVGKGARCPDVEREAQKHGLAEAEFVGTFER